MASRTEYQRAWYDQNKEYVKKQRMLYREVHREEIATKKKARYDATKDVQRAKKRDAYAALSENERRDRHYRCSYGISLEQYCKILSDQGGVCVLCGGPQRGSGKYLCVDHDHTTGEVRGLLCNPCNLGVGLLREKPWLFDKAKEYVSRVKLGAVDDVQDDRHS